MTYSYVITLFLSIQAYCWDFSLVNGILTVFTRYWGNITMARPKTKAELLTASEQQFEKMWQLIDAMPDEEQAATFAFGAEMGKEAHWGRDKNIRDVLIHLYEWHQLLLRWVNANLNGDQQPFLPAPYNWKTYGEMNVGFWERHQETTLADAKAMLHDSHDKVMALIAEFSDEALFTKQYFSWTGTTTLASYCISATVAHYEWAIKKLKAHQKTYQA